MKDKETRVAEGKMAEEPAEQTVVGTGAFTKRRRTVVVASALLVLIVALAGIGIALTTCDAPQKQSGPDMLSENDDKAEGELAVMVVAEGIGEEPVGASLSVRDGAGRSVIECADVPPNEWKTLGKLRNGSYELYVEQAPVAKDGTSYELPGQSTRFVVESGNVKLKVNLHPIPVEEMTEEQIEAAASALVATGNNDAAEKLKALSANHAPASESGSDGAGGQPEAGGSGQSPSADSNTQPEPTPQPAPQPEPQPQPEPEPNPPAHSHDFSIPVTQTYTWLVCGGCSSKFDNQQQWAVHDKEKCGQGDFSHGSYTPCSDSKVVDWRCSCGVYESSQ